MANLLRFEFRKLLRGKIVYIIAAIAVLFVILNGLVFFLFDYVLTEIDPEASGLIGSYSAYYFTKAALTNNFTIIIGVFIAIYACEDFGHGTSKNVIGKGYSRLKVYFSKYIVSLVAVIVMAILCFLTALGFGLILFNNDFGSVTDNVPVIVIGQILCLIVFHSMLFTLAYMIGKSGAAIAINIVAPLGITLILTILDLIINREGFSLSNYWIDGIFSNFTGASSSLNLPTSTTDESLFVSNFILIFVYLAASEALGIFFAQRKQY